MQALAAIDLRGAIYVACPVSSGRRELDLMVRLAQFDRDHLRREHHDQWRREVLEPNRTAAHVAVSMARGRYAGRSVIDPSEFDIEGLEQPHYDSLCTEIIRRHVGNLVLADGWQYSRGARIEAMLALDLSLDIEDREGSRLGRAQIVRCMDAVHQALVESGFPRERAGDLFPAVSPVRRAHDGVHGLQFLEQ
jgi:hypothetical protein